MAPNSLLISASEPVFRDRTHGDVVQKYKKTKPEKFTTWVTVAPNSLLTGASEPVFRYKTHGDLRKANKKSTEHLICLTRSKKQKQTMFVF